jgi:hypothetical protein
MYLQHNSEIIGYKNFLKLREAWDTPVKANQLCYALENMLPGKKTPLQETLLNVNLHIIDMNIKICVELTADTTM